MTFKQLKQKIKKEQKSLAQTIKESKSKRKHKPCGYVPGLESNRYKYRHIHIAYCSMFNNTPYGVIEEPRSGNKPNFDWIDTIKNDWNGQIDDETFCVSA